MKSTQRIFKKDQQIRCHCTGIFSHEGDFCRSLLLFRNLCLRYTTWIKAAKAWQHVKTILGQQLFEQENGRASPGLNILDTVAAKATYGPQIIDTVAGKATYGPQIIDTVAGKATYGPQILDSVAGKATHGLQHHRHGSRKSDLRTTNHRHGSRKSDLRTTNPRHGSRESDLRTTNHRHGSRKSDLSRKKPHPIQVSGYWIVQVNVHILHGVRLIFNECLRVLQRAWSNSKKVSHVTTEGLFMPVHWCIKKSPVSTINVNTGLLWS